MLQNKSNTSFQLIQTKSSHIFQVKLNLQNQTRYIGTLNSIGDGIFFTSRNSRHLFRKTNSLGLNYSLLSSESIKFKWIVIYYNGKKLISSRNYFLKKGKAFQFSKKGFELQQFVPVDELNLKTVRFFESSTSYQLDLFSYAGGM